MEYSSKNSCQIKIPVFHPTMEEFKNFPSYIDYMESQGAHRAGLAKVVPPKEWTPRANGYDDVDLLIPAPIRQVASGNKGMFQQLNIQTKPMTVKEFAKLANSPKYAPPKGDVEELERKFWKNVTFNAPIYGADISGTIYDPEQRVWNVGNLGTILDLISSAYNAKIEGVNTAYLYFGMWKTSFCWHTEDMDLYSINYLHYGEPKFWYGIPPQNSRRFERLVEGFFPNEAKQCSAFMRHKMTHISPHVLKRYSIPYDTMVQRAGEFMITFPYAYHAGFNLGYNCAESTNFASRRWIDFGKNCSQCTCSEDMVRIDMDCFVKTYQPSRYELWRQGLDKGHPEGQVKKSSNAGKPAFHPEIESCSFGTVLSEDVNIPEASGSIRKVSRRHPIISLDDPDDSSPNLTKAIFKSRKHKIIGDEDDVEEDDDDVSYAYNISESKRMKKLKKQSSSVYSTENKRSTDFSPTRTETSDAESRSSNASRKSKSLYKKDYNSKNVKQKKMASSGEQTDMEQFVNKVLSKVPELGDVCRLFSNLPFDLNAEFEFHGMSGRIQPHCDICSIFRNNGSARPQLPRSSRPLLNSVYVRTSKHPVGDGGDDDDDLEEGDLLQCLVCNLVVHAGCYGASYQDPTSWVCDRCSQGDFADLRCCLCQLRGGALKSTACSRWVHVTCALVSCQVVILEGDSRRDVDVSSAQTSSARCTKCFPLLHNFNGRDFLVECSAEDCHERFHVSCAHRSKCQFVQNKIGRGRLQVLVRCRQHVHSLPLSSGDTVVAKHRNHRYYRGLLKNMYEQTFCSVEFEDGSFSKDTFPEDIQNLKITLEDHPPLETSVSVKWSDGQTYNAIFKGISQTTMYQVEFEDSSVLNLERRHVWPDDVNLPRKIISRLSEITDTKGARLSFYETPETLQKRTRGVHLKPIRDDNFV